MPERVALAGVGEGLLGLQAQAVARHHPDHLLDHFGGEDVAHAVELTTAFTRPATWACGSGETDFAVWSSGGAAGEGERPTMSRRSPM